MAGKRAALAFVVVFVVACGGAAPASTTTSSAPSAAATSVATSAPSAAASAAASAASGPKLSDVLSLAKNATYKITYKITASGAGAEAFSGDQTWYFKPPRSRFDFSTSQGGQNLTISFFTLPEGTFYCFNAGQAQCLGVAGVGSPLDQNAAAAAQQSLINSPAAFGASFTGAKTIAGQQAQCWDVNADPYAGAGAFSTGTFCYSKDGVPLLSSFTTGSYQSWSMAATSFTATVLDSDFTLPAKPLSR